MRMVLTRVETLGPWEPAPPYGIPRVTAWRQCSSADADGARGLCRMSPLPSGAARPFEPGVTSPDVGA